MKKLLVSLLILTSLISQAQQKKSQTNYNYLQSTRNAMIAESLFNELNGMALQPVIKTNDVSALIDETLKKGQSIGELVLIKKYKLLLIEYFNQISTFGETDNNLSTNGGLPFQFANNLGSLTFVQNGIFSKYELNELQLDVDQRTKRIIKNIILPSLGNFEPLTKAPQIQFFEINVGYKVRDFSNDYDRGRGEQTSMIISRSVLLQYINSKISDEEVMKKSALYNSIPNSRNIRKLAF